MKKIISIFLTALIVFSSITVSAAENSDRQILLCYDAGGSLVYSSLIKDGAKPDIPREYRDTTKKIYDISAEKFTVLEDRETEYVNTSIDKPEGVVTEGTYIQKLMANLPKDRNSVISPLSLKMAMMMAANGANGDTRKEILDVFDVKSIDEFNEYAARKTKWDTSENEEDMYEDGEFVSEELKIANSIWLNKDYYKDYNAAFSDKFTDTIKEYYNGTVKTVTNDTYAYEVNDWINEMTYGKIPAIMSESDGENTFLSIINTIYLRAKWWLEFDEENTKPDIFIDIDGNEKVTDFMNKETAYSYYEDEGTRMVKLRYQNGMAMWIVLGDDTDFLDKKNKAEGKTVILSIPKFQIEYSVDYSKILQSMGAKKAFADNNADFKSMVTNVPENLKIDSVLQKVVIDVNEKGTEAAAVTDIGLAGMGRPKEKIEFKADRPFTYYITDGDEVLFAGRYVKVE